MGKLIKYRAKETQNLTVVSDKVLRDKNLSMGAKGLLCYLLSMPEGVKVPVDALECCLMEKEETILEFLQELTDEKYLTIEKDGFLICEEAVY